MAPAGGQGAGPSGPAHTTVSAKQLGRSGPRMAMLDAVDLALYNGATPAVYEHVRPVHRAA